MICTRCEGSGFLNLHQIEEMRVWSPMETAPHDHRIEARSSEGPDVIRWEESRYCNLGGGIGGGYGPGWVSVQAGGLPIDDPDEWSELLPETTEEILAWIEEQTEPHDVCICDCCGDNNGGWKDEPGNHLNWEWHNPPDCI